MLTQGNESSLAANLGEFRVALSEK